MKGRVIYLLAMVAIEWFALVAQLVLHLQGVSTGLAESLLRYFSYFTILTNLLVAVYVTAQLPGTGAKGASFFSRPSVQTAIALYITVVGLIYNILLRQLWHSEGLQALIHDLLHTIMPLLIIIYWWIWVDAGRLQFRSIPAWLVYPAVYAGCILVRGHFAGWYPYPFLDAGKLGYSRVAVNSVMMLVLFLLFSCVFIFLGKRKRAR